MVEGLTADREKIRECLILLLDYRWGAKRTARLREAVRMLPRKSPPFRDASTKLQYIVDLCHDNATNIAPVLELLTNADIERKAMWRKFEKEFPNYSARRTAIIYNSRNLRLCQQQAIIIEMLKAGGEPLSDVRKREVKAQYKQMWDEWNDEFLLAHPEMPHKACLHASAESRNARMQEMCDAALAKADPNRKITKDERKLIQLKRTKEGVNVDV